jgi:hypothetical protein
VHQVYASGVRAQPFAGCVKRLWVAVDADQGQLGVRVELRSCVTTETDRGVDHHGLPARQRGTQQLQGSTQQHWGVLE